MITYAYIDNRSPGPHACEGCALDHFPQNGELVVHILYDTGETCVVCAQCFPVKVWRTQSPILRELLYGQANQ